MAKLTTVFWDVDGTLADTEFNGHRVAFNKAFSQFKLGWTWGDNLYADLLHIQGGKKRIAWYAKSIGEVISPELISQIQLAKQVNYRQIVLSGEIKLRIGVKRLINDLKARRVNQWVVTSSNNLSVKALIDFNFNPNDIPFQGFITSDDVMRSKPHPEPYLKAIEGSGTRKENTIVIEDSIAGMISAGSADLATLITLPSQNTNAIKAYNSATAVVDHLGDPLKCCRVLSGPPSSKGRITVDYLQHLIS